MERARGNRHDVGAAVVLAFLRWDLPIMSECWNFRRVDGWNYYAAKMIVLELSLPDQLPLLSSYSRWNQAMDDAIDRRCEAIDGDRFADMFDAPLFKGEGDDMCDNDHTAQY